MEISIVSVAFDWENIQPHMSYGSQNIEAERNYKKKTDYT